jgi:hypothetical protein
MSLENIFMQDISGQTINWREMAIKLSEGPQEHPFVLHLGKTRAGLGFGPSLKKPERKMPSLSPSGLALPSGL